MFIHFTSASLLFYIFALGHWKSLFQNQSMKAVEHKQQPHNQVPLFGNSGKGRYYSTVRGYFNGHSESVKLFFTLFNLCCMFGVIWTRTFDILFSDAVVWTSASVTLFAAEVPWNIIIYLKLTTVKREAARNTCQSTSQLRLN